MCKICRHWSTEFQKMLTSPPVWTWNIIWYCSMMPIPPSLLLSTREGHSLTHFASGIPWLWDIICRVIPGAVWSNRHSIHCVFLNVEVFQDRIHVRAVPSPPPPQAWARSPAGIDRLLSFWNTQFLWNTQHTMLQVQSRKFDEVEPLHAVLFTQRPWRQPVSEPSKLGWVRASLWLVGYVNSVR